MCYSSDEIAALMLSERSRPFYSVQSGKPRPDKLKDALMDHASKEAQKERKDKGDERDR
jgi:hypothetical protein